MSDIVKRLRQRIKTWRDLDLSIEGKNFDGRYLEEDAADEIIRLRNDISLLKAMLPPGYKYETFRIGTREVNDE